MLGGKEVFVVDFDVCGGHDHVESLSYRGMGEVVPDEED